LKKVQRSFVVEHKSGRRKPELKSSSIWGHMDLKSVARDVEEEAMPFLSGNQQGGKAGRQVSSPEPIHAAPLLTRPLGQPTSAPDTQEMIMADETDTTTNADAPAIVENSVAPKKQRQPRARKAAPETATADVTADAATGLNGRQKNGRKAKAVDGTAKARRTAVKRAPKDAQAAPVVSAAVHDEMADLLQLEQENQKLRKLLADKLRSENADLRKRLQLG
jgi:hypothetical protein